MHNSLYHYQKQAECHRVKTIQTLLKGKNLIIGILGYGITGKSFISWATRYLSKENKYIIIDKNFFEVDKIKNITYLPQSLSEDYLEQCDVILPSPGFLLSPQKIWYKKIVTELDLFFFLTFKKKIEVIMITGSVGKTSTTTLIDQCLKKIGKKTIIAGNIGIPILTTFSSIKKNTIFVIEASSSQLEHSLLVAPTYFIITNIYQNHLNIHNSFDEYIKAKVNPIIYHYKKIKKIIIDSSTYSFLKNKFFSIYLQVKSKLIYISENEKKYNTYNLIYTQHNQEITYQNKHRKKLFSLISLPKISFQKNWYYILAVTYEYSKKITSLIKNKNNFHIPEFRLQKIIENTNWIVFNDSKSTIIESTIHALEEIKKNYSKNNTIVIIGGLSKGTSRITGITKISESCSAVYIFGSETIHFKEALKNKKNIYYNNSIEETLSIIKNNHLDEYKNFSYSIKNYPSIALFSPGGSSFDQFSSYIERGKIFSQLAPHYF